MVRNTNASWNTCKTASTGDFSKDDYQSITPGVASRLLSGTYGIYRSFFYFDLSSIPAGSSIQSATLDITSTSYSPTNISLLEGTQADTLSTADYDQFTGDPFDTIQWIDTLPDPVNVNTFTFNDAGITYLESKIGDTTKLCLIEYTHDYLNDPPSPDPSQFDINIHYSEYIWDTKEPRINVTYI